MSDKPEKKDFEEWLRLHCFQEPTPEAYDLAYAAWLKRADLAKPSEWISVSEALPIDGQDVLCFNDTTNYISIMSHNETIEQYHGFFSGRGEKLPTKVHVTHWQPLPSPPSDKE